MSRPFCQRREKERGEKGRPLDERSSVEFGPSSFLVVVLTLCASPFGPGRLNYSSPLSTSATRKGGHFFFLLHNSAGQEEKLFGRGESFAALRSSSCCCEIAFFKSRKGRCNKKKLFSTLGRAPFYCSRGQAFLLLILYVVVRLLHGH